MCVVADPKCFLGIGILADLGFLKHPLPLFPFFSLFELWNLECFRKRVSGIFS